MSELERFTKADLLVAQITDNVPFRRDIVHYDVPQIDMELMPTGDLPPYQQRRQYLKSMNRTLYSRTFDIDPVNDERVSDNYVRRMSRYVLNMPLYLVTTPPAEARMHREVPEFYASRIVNFAAYRKYKNIFIEPIVESASTDTEGLLPHAQNVLGGLYLPKA